MNKMSTPLASLEISDGRLPARMVVGRLRADLSRPAAIRPWRVRLALVLLLLAAPLIGATRHRNAA